MHTHSIASPLSWIYLNRLRLFHTQYYFLHFPRSIGKRRQSETAGCCCCSETKSCRWDLAKKVHKIGQPTSLKRERDCWEWSCSFSFSPLRRAAFSLDFHMPLLTSSMRKGKKQWRRGMGKGMQKRKLRRCGNVVEPCIVLHNSAAATVAVLRLFSNARRGKCRPAVISLNCHSTNTTTTTALRSSQGVDTLKLIGTMGMLDFKGQHQPLLQ